MKLSPTLIRNEVTSLIHQGVLNKGSMNTAAQPAWYESTYRGDSMCWLRNDSPLSTSSHISIIPPPTLSYIISCLNSSIAALSSLSSSFPIIPSSTQLAVYSGDGARYVRHRDSHDKGGPHRRLTCIWYGNNDWQHEHGGYLRLYLPHQYRDSDDVKNGTNTSDQDDVGDESYVDISPIYDRLVLFLSGEMEHEVLPSYHQRIALTTWFK